MGPHRFQRWVEARSRCKNDDSVVATLAIFSSRALALLSDKSDGTITTLRGGLSSCKQFLSPATRNKVNKLSLAYAVVRHVTGSYCDDLIQDLERELFPAPAAPLVHPPVARVWL